MLSKERLKALGVLAGAGVASGFLGFYYLWKRQKRPLELEGLWEEENLRPISNPEQPSAGTEAHQAPNGPSEEQVEIRWHLDSIQSCLDGLKEEVSSLKGCIQTIVQKQASLRKHKSARRKKRRCESKRDSDDSTESVSIHFTANAGKASDSESEAGPIGIPAALDRSMLAFTASSFTDDRTGLDAESPFLQFQQEAGHTTACTDKEVEKEDEQDSNLVQILGFSLALEPEAGSDVQILSLSEVEQNEMSSLLQEVDRLHGGSHKEQEHGFKVLLDNKNKYGKKKEFCWRMIRAYSDMFQLTEDEETQKCYALAGKDEATASLQDHGDSIECQIWLAVMCGYLQDHDTEERCEKNEDLLKESQDQADVLVEVINSCDNICSDPSNIPVIDTAEITEVDDTNEKQDMQPKGEGNILVEVFNSYDSSYAIAVTDSTETIDMEDRNKEQDMKALDEANLMVEFIDGYHITYSNECSVAVKDTAKTAEMESEDEQDEIDEVTGFKYWRDTTEGEEPTAPTYD